MSYRCELDSLIAPSDETLIYHVLTPAIEVDIGSFQEDPECGYQIVYSYTMQEDGGSLPDWIVLDK